MKKLGTAFVMAAAGGMLLAGPATGANMSMYNQESYWEEYLANTYGGTWTCEKTEVDDSYGTVVVSGADKVIVKGGNVMPIEGLTPPQNPASGKPYGISWFMECDTDDDYYET